MNKLSEFLINFQESCQVEKHVHVYALDLKNTILACNKTQLMTLEESFKVSSNDIIGTSLEELANANKLLNIPKIFIAENGTVIKSRSPKQFYNIWVVSDLYIIEFLTIKIPMYTTEGKLAGIFGFSHYINKFSIEKAAMLGLSKRETECLFYLLGGKCNKEIAKLLNISLRTVENYFDHIRLKLGCFNKSDLISKARQTRLIEGTSEGLISLKRIFSSLGKLPDKLNFNTAVSSIVIGDKLMR